LTTKTRRKIITHEEKCVGCRICQLWCSYQFTRKFTLSKAYIRVDNPYGLEPKISFLEDCTKCGKCADYCLYGALEKIEERT